VIVGPVSDCFVAPIIALEILPMSDIESHLHINVLVECRRAIAALVLKQHERTELERRFCKALKCDPNDLPKGIFVCRPLALNTYDQLLERYANARAREIKKALRLHRRLPMVVLAKLLAMPSVDIDGNLVANVDWNAPDIIEDVTKLIRAGNRWRTSDRALQAVEAREQQHLNRIKARDRVIATLNNQVEKLKAEVNTPAPSGVVVKHKRRRRTGRL